MSAFSLLHGNVGEIRAILQPAQIIQPSRLQIIPPSSLAASPCTHKHIYGTHRLQGMDVLIRYQMDDQNAIPIDLICRREGRFKGEPRPPIMEPILGIDDNFLHLFRSHALPPASAIRSWIKTKRVPETLVALVFWIDPDPLPDILKILRSGKMSRYGPNTLLAMGTTLMLPLARLPESTVYRRATTVASWDMVVRPLMEQANSLCSSINEGRLPNGFRFHSLDSKYSPFPFIEDLCRAALFVGQLVDGRFVRELCIMAPPDRFLSDRLLPLYDQYANAELASYLFLPVVMSGQQDAVISILLALWIQRHLHMSLSINSIIRLMLALTDYPVGDVPPDMEFGPTEPLPVLSLRADVKKVLKRIGELTDAYNAVQTIYNR